MPEKEKKPLPEEIVDLAARVCDETISAEDLERLERLLQEHAEVRTAYLDYVRVHAGLNWRYRTGMSPKPALPGGASAEPDPEGPQPEPASTFRARETWQASLVSRFAIVAGICASLACAAFLLMPEPADERAAEVASASPAAEPLFVATLRNSTHVVWSNDSRAVNVGSRIERGLVRIDAGEAEVVFDSGARLMIAGPAELELKSALAACLNRGTAAAHMPLTAVGFELRTPTSTLVDQGTEFGVVVEETGATEVHVFRGQVDLVLEDVESSGSEPVVEMVDRQARRIEEKGKAGQQVEFSKSRFGSLATKVSAPLQWKVSDGGNDHYYQLVIADKPITWHEAARNAMNSHYRGLPGHLITLTSAEENAFVKQSLVEQVPTRGLWIGLTDVVREGFFTWVTGEPFEFTDWASWPVQQPDNFQETSWHGGEDYGIFTNFPESQPWAWNDLSVDSIHENISAYLVEYEPPVEALKHRSLPTEPVQWRLDQGGNGHYYRLIIALQPTDWETIRARAAETEVLGVPGRLLAMETESERRFIVDQVLRVCGVPEVMVGLEGNLQENQLRWINGQPIENLEVGRPRLPTEQVYGLFRWDASKGWPDGWIVQTLDKNVVPAEWFGYLVEYPVGTAPDAL